MGLFRKLVARRIARLDLARVELFDLFQDEFPIEAQPVTIESAWPAALGLPLSPSDAEKIAYTASILMEGLRLRLPVLCVGMLTSTHFRWVPHRTYRNSEVYQEPLNGILSEGGPKGEGIYTKFSHPTLGACAVPVEQIKRISVTAFMPPDFSVLDVFLTDYCEIVQPGPWPIYEQSQIADVMPPVWLPENSASRYLRLVAQGASALTIALSWSQAFDYLEIPVQTEALEEGEMAAWNDWRSMERKEPWRTLSQRLSD